MLQFKKPMKKKKKLENVQQTWLHCRREESKSSIFRIVHTPVVSMQVHINCTRTENLITHTTTKL